MTTDHGIEISTRGAVEIWTLNRPDVMNALSRETVKKIFELAHLAKANPAVRAIVITGEGEKSFCAGADLKERKTMSIEDVEGMLSSFRRSFDAVDMLPKPVFAAINGVAYGGGFELALACDFRVMAAHAKVGLTEVSLAIIPGAGGTQRLTRLIGPAKAKKMILFSEVLSADDAMRLGVTDWICGTSDTALEFAVALAEKLTHGAPIAIAAALEAIDGVRDSLHDGLDVERAAYERTLYSKDRLESLSAFAEKRKPLFRGE